MRHELQAVHSDLGGFLHDRPRRLFALVPLVRGGPHDIARELVDPLLHLDLFFVQLHRERYGCGGFGCDHRSTPCAARCLQSPQVARPPLLRVAISGDGS